MVYEALAETVDKETQSFLAGEHIDRQGGTPQTLQGQKLLDLGPFQISPPYKSLYLALHLYLYDKTVITTITLPELCESFQLIVRPEGGSWETPNVEPRWPGRSVGWLLVFTAGV